MRLDITRVNDLCELSNQLDFPYKITLDIAKIYCNGLNTVKTYGIYCDNKLVSIMTATFCIIFPHTDSPNGKMVHISGAYTHPDYRHHQYATQLIQEIEQDAKIFRADYLCCDSTADKLYINNGFIPAPNNESRLWKQL